MSTGIVWCMEHEADEEMETEERGQESALEGDDSGMHADMSFEGWTNTGKSISSVTQDLLEDLQHNKEYVVS